MAQDSRGSKSAYPPEVCEGIENLTGRRLEIQGAGTVIRFNVLNVVWSL